MRAVTLAQLDAFEAADGRHADARMTSCRFCAAPLEATFADLGMSPLANSYLTPEQANGDGAVLPAARAASARSCFLVQLEEFESPEHIFSDYAYFSSYSSSWLEHSERYVDAMIERFGLDGSSHVVEVASNDGYLLQYFVERGVPVLGIEPAANVAEVAEEKRRADARASSSASRPRARSPRRIARPTCCSATTCSPTCPTSTTSSAA